MSNISLKETSSCTIHDAAIDTPNSFQLKAFHDFAEESPQIMKFVTALTIEEAGWLELSSLNRWHEFSVVLPNLRATKPKTLKAKILTRYYSMSQLNAIIV